MPRSQTPPPSPTHINAWAWFCLTLPSLCLLLFISGSFSLIWQFSWFPFWFLRHWGRGLFLFFLRWEGQWFKVIASGLRHGVCVVQKEVVLFLIFYHLPVHTDSAKPGPGQRSGVLLTLKQVPRGHFLLRRDLETLQENSILWQYTLRLFPAHRTSLWACGCNGFRGPS